MTNETEKEPAGNAEMSSERWQALYLVGYSELPQGLKKWMLNKWRFSLRGQKTLTSLEGIGSLCTLCLGP